jgi:hypothetical protein
MTNKTPVKINPTRGLRAIEQLKESIEELKVFLDPGNVECDVRRDARESSQLYLETWVLQPLEEALRLLEGRESEYVISLRNHI